MLPPSGGKPPDGREDLFILQAGNAGQLQAFQELQGSAAAGGNVGDLVSKAQLLTGSGAVTASDDGHGGRLLSAVSADGLASWKMVRHRAMQLYLSAA